MFSDPARKLCCWTGHKICTLGFGCLLQEALRAALVPARGHRDAREGNAVQWALPKAVLVAALRNKVRWPPLTRWASHGILGCPKINANCEHVSSHHTAKPHLATSDSGSACSPFPRGENHRPCGSWHIAVGGFEYLKRRRRYGSGALTLSSRR